MSPGTRRSKASAAPAPWTSTWPMCETSNSAAALAALPVLGHDAGRVLHRQRPAGEVDHPAAELDVQVVQRRAARGRVGWRVTDRSRPGPPRGCRPTRLRRPLEPPLSQT